MRSDIRFLLNGEEQSVKAINPDTTLLNWLRLNKMLTGTKEGCGEGDCGACTVVVADLNQSGQLVYKAVNACILFLPMLDGLSITTVEALRRSDGALHPVQAAIVAGHGAQCGFCTPGFVMSLYAGYENGMADNRLHIQQILSGNLCRCTGYGALIDAGLSAARHSPSASEHEADLSRRPSPCLQVPRARMRAAWRAARGWAQTGQDGTLRGAATRKGRLRCELG